MTSSIDVEPITSRDDPSRWVMFPIRYDHLWELYKKSVASFWTPEELDLDQDMKDYLSLSDGEKQFINNVLAFFAASDGIVVENLAANFLNEVTVPEARAFYTFQAAMETIHSETYSLLIATYIRDPSEQQRLLDAVVRIPAVTVKAEWAARWLESSRPFAERLVAFAAVEGILFSGSFCAIFWLRKRGLMPGLTFSNELIARDEGLHTEFACALYSLLQKKCSADVVHRIVREAVGVERIFICDSIPCALLGMSDISMNQYIQYVADRLLTQLGYEKIFLVANPFDWMELISLQGKTNFFEKRVAEYQKSGVMSSVSNRDTRCFSLQEDF